VTERERSKAVISFGPCIVRVKNWERIDRNGQRISA
jgi:hypothetical protein